MSKKKRGWFDEHVIVDCGDNKELAREIKERLRKDVAREIQEEVVIVKGFGDQTGEVANMLRSSLRTLKRKYNLQQKQAGAKR